MPLSSDDVWRIASVFVEHCNTERLQIAIAYIGPLDKLESPASQIIARRRVKLAVPTRGTERAMSVSRT